MLQSKLLVMLLGAIALNAGLVVWSVVERHALADEPASGKAVGSNPEEPTGVEPADARDSASAEGSAEAEGAQPPTSVPSDPQRVLDSLPVPPAEEFPQVPTAEALESDPAFQKFRDEVAEQYPLIESGSSGSPTVEPSLGDTEFSQLEDRLNAVKQLTEAALSVTHEARRLAKAGDRQRAARVLAKARQIRSLSAELLDEEL